MSLSLLTINQVIRSQVIATIGLSSVLRDGEEKALVISAFGSNRRIWRGPAEKQAFQVRMPAALVPSAKPAGSFKGHMAYGDTCVDPQPEGSP